MDGLRCLCASANHIIAKCVLFGFLCFCFLCFREKRVILRGGFFPVGLSCVAYRLGSLPWSSGSARTQRLKLRFFSRLFFFYFSFTFLRPLTFNSRIRMELCTLVCTMRTTTRWDPLPRSSYVGNTVTCFYMKMVKKTDAAYFTCRTGREVTRFFFFLN